MNQKVYGAVDTGLWNTINTSAVNPRQYEKWTYIGRRVGAGPATVARRGNGRFWHFRKKLVIFSLLICGRTLTEISTSASENEAGYLMWELKGAAVGIT